MVQSSLLEGTAGLLHTCGPIAGSHTLFDGLHDMCARTEGQKEFQSLDVGSSPFTLNSDARLP